MTQRWPDHWGRCRTMIVILMILIVSVLAVTCDGPTQVKDLIDSRVLCDRARWRGRCTARPLTTRVLCPPGLGGMEKALSD